MIDPPCPPGRSGMIPLRPAAVVLVVFLVCGVAFAATVVDALQAKRHTTREAANRQWVRTLQLTDLALFTEARYTRHPSQADRHTPFQDHPFALEHFPSGSLLAPSPHLTEGNHAPLD